MKIEIRSQDIQNAVRDRLNEAIMEGIRNWKIREAILAEFEKGIDVSGIVAEVKALAIQAVMERRREIVDAVRSEIETRFVADLCDSLSGMAKVDGAERGRERWTS